MRQATMAMGLVLVGLQVASEAPQANAQSREGASLKVTVVAEDGTPVSSAQVEVLKWTGTWDTIGAAGKVDNRGTIALEDLPVEEYLSVVAHAEGFAATMQDVSLTGNEQREITIRLSPPAHGWLEILSRDGKPVEGAEIQRLDFTDASGSQVVLTADTAEALGQQLQKSDANGRLSLPEMPSNCSFTVWIVHPRWKVAKAENLHTSSGLITSMTLQPGVSVRVKLQGDEQALEKLEGEMAEVLLFPETGGSSQPETVCHSFPVQGGFVDFTAYATEYSELRFTLDDYLTTPQLFNHPRWPNRRLDLESSEERTFELLLHPKTKVRGRVVDVAGNPIANAYVSGRIENLLADWQETGVRTPEKLPFKAASSATTDANGEYEIDLAKGKCGVAIMCEGYFSNPSFFEMEIDAEKENDFPDVVLHAVPTLTGKVFSADGQLVSDAIVRMRSTGIGDTDPVAKTNAEGKFQLELSRVPHRQDGDGLQTDVAVVAIDPGAMTVGMANVDLLNESSTSEIVVHLGERAPDWILDPLDQEADSVEDAEKEAMRQSLKELAEKFPAGRRGESVPNLREGTWLNSDASSLEDFRGKYVLLDFWFIGCGPCHRDMPTVKMAHAAFKDKGFTVVSIHINSQTPDNVQQFANANGMEYPIVVDNSAGDIMKQFGELGIYYYPSYILLDPEGRILINDAVREQADPSLRLNKIEAIFHALQIRS